MRTLLLLSLLFQSLLIFAQSPGHTGSDEDREAIVGVIRQMFDGMRAGDSSMVAATFAPGMSLKSVSTDQQGRAVIRKGSASRFLEAVGTPHEEIWDERIWSYELRVDGRMATVWTEYTFYRGDQLSHCGVNAFTLFNSDQGWQITDITDTRRKKDCRKEAIDAEAEIAALLDAWHRAAAVADEELFFGSMTEDAIYLGTDDSERWGRDEMRKWSKEYFDKESAWDFTPSSRHIYLSPDGRTAWFEEKLATWMGPCRGSGVVEREGDAWKISHYNLTVTVPNNKIEAFIELMKGKE